MSGETVKYVFEVVLTSDGECPTPEEAKRLVQEQMGGVLDDQGLRWVSVDVIGMTGELDKLGLSLAPTLASVSEFLEARWANDACAT